MITVRAEQPWSQTETFTASNFHKAVENLARAYTTKFTAQGWSFPLRILANEVYSPDDEPLAPFTVVLLGPDKKGRVQYELEGL